jgi:hypothetical protein
MHSACLADLNKYYQREEIDYGYEEYAQNFGSETWMEDLEAYVMIAVVLVLIFFSPLYRSI